MQKLDTIDHVAIRVDDLTETVAWYRRMFNCNTIYEDDTWAIVEFANIKLAFVIKEQHPPHLAFYKADAADFGRLKKHRDDSISTYVKDPSGNFVELIAKKEK
ncbi:MAG: VOC family protein [Francisellaceae bacterium]